MAKFGFEYRKTDSGIVIEKFYGSDSVVDVPPRISGLPVVEINTEAFSECTGVEKIFLPDSLKLIGDAPFFVCESLTEIYWRDLLIKIGGDEFKISAGTPTEIHLPRFPIHRSDKAIQTQADNIADAPPRITGLPVVKKEISSTPADQFKYRKTDSGNGIVIEKYLGSDSVVDVPPKINGLPVLTIGENAFSDCTGLTKIRLHDGLQSIGNNAFDGCTSLKEIYFPDGLQTIGEWAFSGCTGLTEIHLPDSMKFISLWAFGACTSLTKIHLPSSLKSISGVAFDGCSGLTEIHLPDSMKFISLWAFGACTSLTKIHLPSSLKSISGVAFDGCTNLTDAYMSKEFSDDLKTAIRDALPESCEIHYV